MNTITSKKPELFADPFQLKSAAVEPETGFHGQNDQAREQVLRKIAENPKLPSPPALALEIIKKANDPNCGVEDISKLVCLDPGVSARLLKTINSALFALSRPVTSLDLALSLMGIKQFRSLVLGLSLPSLQNADSNPEVLKKYWKSSVAGAIIARELAIFLQRPEPEDDMIAALLRDIEEIILDRLFPGAYQRVQQGPAEFLALSQCRLEERLLRINHAEVSAFLLEQWGMPPEICQPIRYHHTPTRLPGEDRAMLERVKILHFATRAAHFLVMPKQAELGARLILAAQEEFGMNEAQFAEFMQPLHRKTEEFVQLLRVDIGKSKSYFELFTQAVDDLIQQTVEASTQTSRELDGSHDTEMEAWRLLSQKLHPGEARDPLADLFHRHHLEKLLVLEFHRARKSGKMLGLILLDLQNFKSFNRRLGSKTGDLVLKEIAKRLRREVRGEEIVGRWAGEKFLMILPQAQNIQARLEALNDLMYEFRLGNPQAMDVKATLAGVQACPRLGFVTLEKIRGALADVLRIARHQNPALHLLALFQPEEKELIDSLEKQRFTTLLREQNLAAPKILQTLDFSPRSASLGRFLRNQGFLRPRKVKTLLKDLKGRRRPWMTLLRQYITIPQIAGWLAIRQEPPELVLQELIQKSAVKEADCKRILTDYYRRLG